MGVVLSAMGGYGTYLGWNLRLGNDEAMSLEEAGTQHGRLMAGCVGAPSSHTALASRRGDARSLDRVVADARPPRPSAAWTVRPCAHRMFVFFALGAVGGLLSLTMQGKPLLSSGHATSAIIGLLLLSFQACLPLAFEEQPELRTAHAYFGSAIMAVFALHASLGVKLALSL